MRLTGEAVSSTISANSYTDTYSYDLVGNRLSKTDVVGSTTTVTNDIFNNNDQLTSETGTVNNVSSWSTSFQYDPNGSLTNVNRTGSGAESDTYGYDLQHRLNYANITRTEQGQSVGIVVNYYLYDDSGYRASGSVTVTVNGTPTTTVTNYLTDMMNPTGYSQVREEHLGNSSSPSMSYIVGLAVLAQTNSSSATTYLMVDAQGSTRQLTDSSGNITARFAYDAYGNLLPDHRPARSARGQEAAAAGTREGEMGIPLALRRSRRICTTQKHLFHGETAMSLIQDLKIERGNDNTAPKRVEISSIGITENKSLLSLIEDGGPRLTDDCSRMGEQHRLGPDAAVRAWQGE